MMSWLGRLLREQGRQITTGTSRSRVTSPGVTTGAQAAEAIPSTLVHEDGTGLDLFIIGEDYLGDDGYYIGDDPIEENTQ